MDWTWDCLRQNTERGEKERYKIFKKLYHQIREDNIDATVKEASILYGI
ncbi:MAG: hypothetical protein L6N96_05930 [Candidatus Methylarchaceae archaeon HK02M2]|nr:hypothetical protein [Candidatus Methylarchaceae archaeon HK02M2]